MIDISNDFEVERKQKEALDIIEYLQTNAFTNKQSRIEFSLKLSQLVYNDSLEARKFISKLALFAKYYGKDQYIDEDEWRKLNNTQIAESVEPVKDVATYKSLYEENALKEATLSYTTIEDIKIGVSTLIAKIVGKYGINHPRTFESIGFGLFQGLSEGIKNSGGGKDTSTLLKVALNKIFKNIRERF